MDYGYGTQLDNRFKGQFRDEVLLDYFRSHWVRILGPLIVISITFLVILLYLFYFFSGAHGELIRSESLNNVLDGTVIIVSTVLIHHYFIKIFNFYLTKVIITNYRVIDHDKSVFFTDSKDALVLGRVQDIIKVQDGILPTFLNYGTLKVTSSFSDKIIKITCVPRPDYFYKILTKARKIFSEENSGQGRTQSFEESD